MPELVEGPTADPSLIFRSCIHFIVILALAYMASDIVLPIVLAFVLSLLFNPGMRLLARAHAPGPLADLHLMLAVFGAIVAIGAAMAAPAASWAQKLPGGITRIEERLQITASERSWHLIHPMH
jgi:predicted PurR-regulated permease PerM